jgi:hypothetical protein
MIRLAWNGQTALAIRSSSEWGEFAGTAMPPLCNEPGATGWPPEEVSAL